MRTIVLIVSVVFFAKCVVASTPSAGSHFPPQLPWDVNSMAGRGFLTKEQIDAHFTEHHLVYAQRVMEFLLSDPNKAAAQDLVAGLTEETDVKKALEDVLAYSANRNLALWRATAQVINHNAFWDSISDKIADTKSPKYQPNGAGLALAIAKTFGSVEKLISDFTSLATRHFGSGWVWLVVNHETLALDVVDTHDAEPPSGRPLLGLDVWEHSYYIDYHGKDKPLYTKRFWEVANWRRACDNYNSMVLNRQEL
eukprot:PhM_4_TR18710/c0_g1_i7/m.62222/K04564/SOD2; superoxide dismutase, Fe-Mn family